MVVGSPRRIKKEVLELIKQLPCANMDTKLNDVIEILALFCKECPREFEKWQRQRLKKKR